MWYSPVLGSGSCCHADGTCSYVAQTECNGADDVFGGLGTTCAAATCCPHGSYIWADADVDGDVDQDDFGIFQACYSGTEAAPEGCACFERDSVTGIGNADLTAFENCVTGPMIEWTPETLWGCP